MKRAVYAGSFDPPTLAHLCMAMKAAMVFDKVTVVIADNPAKTYMFTPNERIALFRDMLKGTGLGIKVRYTSGTVGEVARKVYSKFFVRGLRDTKDLEAEMELEKLNLKYFPDMKTVYLTTEWQNVSSSALKKAVQDREIFGKYQHFCTPKVWDALWKKIHA